MFIITGQLKLKQNLHHIGGHDVLPSPFDIFFWGGDVFPTLSPAGFTPLLIRPWHDHPRHEWFECKQIEHRRRTHFNHSFKWDQHRAEMFVDRQQMKQSSEVENVADGEQTLTHVYRVPRVPVIPIYSI